MCTPPEHDVHVICMPTIVTERHPLCVLSLQIGLFTFGIHLSIQTSMNSPFSIKQMRPTFRASQPLRVALHICRTFSFSLADVKSSLYEHHQILIVCATSDPHCTTQSPLYTSYTR